MTVIRNEELWIEGLQIIHPECSANGCTDGLAFVPGAFGGCCLLVFFLLVEVVEFPP